MPRRIRLLIAAVLAVVTALGGVTASSAMTEGLPQTAGVPWMAMIQNPAGGKCSGAVVGDGWVLTAAHCTYTEHGERKYEPNELKVFVGRGDGNRNVGSEYTVKQALPMPGYNPKNSWGGVNNVYDAALLKLAEFNGDNWHALPIAFARSVVYGTGGVTIFGYGDTYSLPDLRHVVKDLRISQVGFGAGSLWKSPQGAFEQMRDGYCSDKILCFHRTSGTKIMSGDSGGPWLRWVNGAWQVIGVQASVVDSVVVNI